MAELSKPIAPSSFYLEFDGLTDLAFQSVEIPQYQPKVQGGQQAIGTTKGGKKVWQVNTAGFEGLFTFTCDCIASGDSDSASVKMYEWFQTCLPSSNGGKSDWGSSKKSGAITAYDTDGKEIAKWEFAEAWPHKYKCADLNVTEDAYIKETFSLKCEKFNRVQ